jgi:hypothetical protein
MTTQTPLRASAPNAAPPSYRPLAATDPGERSYPLPGNLVARLKLSGEPTREALEELAFLIQRWATYTPTTTERSNLDAFQDGLSVKSPAPKDEPRP